MNDATKKIVMAVLSTLAESESGIPESMIYLAVGADLATCNTVCGAMQHASLITIRGNYVELTAEGRKLGDKINNALATAAE